MSVFVTKLVYAKNTKWLLSGPHQLQKFAH
jgi:hypothetical protein